MNRVHLIIEGRVQGVFFRHSSRVTALELGLRGWVRNRSAGSVEVVAEGPLDKLDAFVEWCKVGPEAAHVIRVERVDAEPAGLPGGFDVRPTL